MREVPVACGRGLPGRWRRRSWTGPCQRFARNCATRNLTSPQDALVHSALTWAVVWVREVLRGIVNHPHIDGMQGVRVQISSAPPQVRGPVRLRPPTNRPPRAAKSAAICLCEANSGRRHTVDSGQHRRGPRPVDRAPPGHHHQPGRARRRPDRPRIHSSRPGSLCVERWMALVPDERRVVPHMGDSRKNGAHGANANRAEVPTYSAGRRAPSCVSQDGESLGTGGQAALPPHPGWPPTLPRCRDPGIGEDPFRAFRRPAAHLVFLGTPERLHPWLPRYRCCP